MLSRPPRDPRLDAIRGFMQLQIFASHILGSIAGWGIHAAWGLSDSSEQFVLLSGLGLGSVFTLKMARDGFAPARADLLRRTWRLYRISLLVFVLFAVLVLWAERGIPLPGEIKRLGWIWMDRDPLSALLAAPTLLYQPVFMGILPVFVWCMMMLPGFLWLAQRSVAATIAVSAGLWLAAQAGLAPPSIGGTGIAFNPFAWQVLYVAGALAGRQVLLRGSVLPRGLWVVMLAGSVVALGLWLRLGWYGWLPGWAVLPVPEAMWMVGKESLALPRFIHAIALAVLAARLLPREGTLAAPFLGPLRDAGRGSLEVFCLGLFVSWMATTILRLSHGVLWVDLAVVVGGSALLLAFAVARERGFALAGPVRAR